MGDRESKAVSIGPLFLTLGELVFSFNSAEHALRRLAFLMIDPADERTGEITVDRLGANGLEELVRALGDYRLGAESELANRLSAAVSRFSTVRQRRNDFVHGLWVVPNDFDGPQDIVAIKRSFRKGTTLQVATMDPQPIAHVASEIGSVNGDLQALHEEIAAYLTRE